MKVTEEKADARDYVIVLEGPPGATQLLKVRRNRSNVTVQGGTETDADVAVILPEGTGVQRQTISFHW